MVTQMMAVGEETGAFDALTSLLEPPLIVVLGSAVGTMVISLYMPMFDIIKLIN
jgi:type IV pilus assembly protein PilC